MEYLKATLTMERWPSGLRHMPAKHGRLIASVGSNPTLSAN